MSRQDATDLLMGEREGGVFLVRDSATIQVRLMAMVKVNTLVMFKTTVIVNIMDASCHGGGDQSKPDDS